MRKGVLNIDFIIAFVLFIVIYFSIFQSMLFFSIGSREAPDELLMESRYLSNILVETGGYPKNWSLVDYLANPELESKYIGLAYFNKTVYPNILDLNKIKQIDSYNCETLRLNKTDLTINFKITVSTQKKNYSCTATPGSDAREIERIVYVFDGRNYTSAKLILQTW